MSDTESTSKKPKQYTSVIKQKDIKRYEEMGLGRGVDVTDPKMWRNKSSFIVRTVCPKLSNITGTDEGCMKEKYEKEVSTVAMHQQKIRLSLEEPVKIAIDAHSSQSTSSAKTISGTKVTTSTIAFKVNLKALKVDFEESNAFEDELYSWILSCIESRDTVVAKKLREDTAHDELASSSLRGSGHGDKANDKLATSATLIKKLEEIGEDKNKNRELVNDCTRFVVTYGVTHYISAIKLGAMLYRVASAHTKQTTLGAGAEVGGRGMAVRGAMSRSKHIFKKFEAEQEIGRIGKDGQVEKENEAVIGCQILPVYKLVKIPLIQKKLQEAIKEYIQIKEEKRAGPFLISCLIEKKPIYWTVDEENGQILGTVVKDKASPFYIIPTEDKLHPADFLIAYYGEQQDMQEMNQNKRPSLPLYLEAKSNVFGYCKGPLIVKDSIEIAQARFCLHSRVQYSPYLCSSTPVSWNTWLEGEKFYINCSNRSFKVNGYIAAIKQESSKQNSRSTYKTVTVPRIKDPQDSKEYGMLFQLEPLDSEGEPQASQINSEEQISPYEAGSIDTPDGPDTPRSGAEATANPKNPDAESTENKKTHSQ